MQEYTLNDGRRFRQFIASEPGGKSVSEVLAEEYRQAMAKHGDNVREIRQVQIGRNDRCPCGSGTKFKYCCLRKVNQGEEEVSSPLTATEAERCRAAGMCEEGIRELRG